MYIIESNNKYLHRHSSGKYFFNDTIEYNVKIFKSRFQASGVLDRNFSELNDFKIIKCSILVDNI